MTAEQNAPSPNEDELLVDYLENAKPPMRPRTPIGPPDVQPGETPIKSDE